MTGGGSFGEPWDTVIAAAGVLVFVALVWKIVTTNPPRLRP